MAADWPGSGGRVPSNTPSTTTTASNPKAAHFQGLRSAGITGGGATAGTGAGTGDYEHRAVHVLDGPALLVGGFEVEW